MVVDNAGAAGDGNRPGLRVIREAPLCAETLLEAQTGLITPNQLFFHRNNFEYPSSRPALQIGGAVEAPISIPLSGLTSLATGSLVVTLECAGNGRYFMDPPVEGEPWRLGAVSTALWSGVPLRSLLDKAGLQPGAVEVAFEGADGFTRSLPVEVALHPDTLLATEMNGSPLPPDHGGPLRLIVPGWYGMASVKWVAAVIAVTEPFAGHFQTERYVIEGRPIREMKVRALISEPVAGASVEGPTVTLAGYAWTGRGVVTGVRLSDDAGASWLQADLVATAPPYGWSRWEVAWRPRRPGPASLVAQAIDSEGGVQPLDPVWNRLGYCYNTAVPHPLHVT